MNKTIFNRSLFFLFLMNLNYAQEISIKGEFIPLSQEQISLLSPNNISEVKKNSTIVYAEDFEGISNWSLNEDLWQIGSPSIGPKKAFQNEKCLATNLAQNYKEDASAHCTSPPIKLPTTSETQSIILSFATWYYLESGWDFGKVKISTDDGVTWKNLGASINGTSGYNWVLYELDITFYNGKTVKLAFDFISDGSISGYGLFIDNISIVLQTNKNLFQNLARINISSFPTIKVYSIITDSLGNSINGLNKSNFTLTEKAEDELTATSENIDVISIQGTGGISVALVIDKSPSMGGDPLIAAKNAAKTFVNYFNNYDRGAIVSFCATVSINQSFTSNKTLLTNAINSISSCNATAVFDGAYKGLDLIKLESSGARAIIVLTDGGDNSSSHTDAQVIQYAKQIGVPIWTIGLQGTSFTTQTEAILKSMANQTGGQYFYAPSSNELSTIYNKISSAVRNQYLLAYNSHNSTNNSLLRTVKVTVSYSAEQDLDSIVYRVTNAPTIRRTPATVALGNQSQIQGSSIPIAAWINGPLGILQASLFYKNALDTGEIFSEVKMNRQTVGDSTFIGWLPGTVVNPPGMNYYLTASDSFTTVSDPINNPQIFPYQFAVLPNQRPVIQHSPVTSASVGQPITIEMTVSDSTQYVLDAKMYYRKTGNVLYSEILMSRIDGTNLNGTYRGIIPASEVTDVGIDYYLQARDNYFVASYSGDDLNPHHISTDLDMVLLSNYMPKLFFTDGEHEGQYFQEKFFPQAIPWFVDNSKLYDKSNNLTDPHPTSFTLPVGQTDLYLKLNEPYHSNPNLISYSETPFIYGRVAQEAQWVPIGVPAKILQYWIFYPYNKFYVNGYNIVQGDHEGDWELVEIKLNPDNTPNEVSFSQHFVYEIQKWVNVEKVSNTHPKVYVANGTHANYFTPGEHSVLADNMPEALVNFFLFKIVNDLVSPNMSLEIQRVLLDINPRIILSDVERWLVEWLVSSGVEVILNFQEVWNRGLQTFREFVRQVYTFSPALSGFDLALGNRENFGTGGNIQLRKIDYATPWVNYHGKWGEVKVDLIGGIAPPPDGLSVRKSWQYPFKKFNVGIPFLIGTFAYIDPFDFLIFEVHSPIKISITDSLGRSVGYQNDQLCSEIPTGYYVINQNEITKLVLIDPKPSDFRLNIIGMESGRYSIDVKFLALGRETEKYIIADDISQGQTISIPFKVISDSTELSLELTPVTNPPLGNESVYSFPNPFNPDFQQSNIRYTLGKDGNVSIKIYDTANNLVRIIMEGISQNSNIERAIQWDGRNDKGQIVSNGVYFYIIDSGSGERAVGKIAVLR